MTSALIANLRQFVDTPRDGALLRFSLGSEYLKSGDAHSAQLQFAEAVSRDPAYSAAWKQLGKALTATGRPQAALDAYRRGIAVAESKGDRQAAREMALFARRIEKQLESGREKQLGPTLEKQLESGPEKQLEPGREQQLESGQTD